MSHQIISLNGKYLNIFSLKLLIELTDFQGLIFKDVEIIKKQLDFY